MRPAHEIRNCAALAAGAMLCIAASATMAADAEHGEDLAEMWCNACHSIGTDAPRQEDAGPMFTELAMLSADEIATALETPHDFMPDFPSLSETDKEDLVAYIGSLAN